jgi:23S rRNA pseudouridine1911/1915/1917 synthase
VIDIEVPAALDGERLDRAVATLADLPRAGAAGLIDDGAVRVGGQVVTQRSHRLALGDRLAFAVPDEVVPGIVGDGSVPVTVVHEDPDVLVVDKDAGVVVHPGAGHAEGTLVHGLLARYPELVAVGQPDRPGIVHRLDVGTSGLLLVARTPLAYEALVRQLQQRTVERVYDTLVWGLVEGDSGVVDAPIGRSPRAPTKMDLRVNGRPARTRYDVRSRWSSPGVTRLHCRLETGRTHQIRVHLSAIDHPVVGDHRYGGARGGIDLDRPFLHATHLGFHHPGSDRWSSFDSPLPDDLVGVLTDLGAPDGAGAR